MRSCEQRERLKGQPGLIDIFREVRERVSAQEAARIYGLTFDRKGWALCPFHNDNSPSMSFKDDRFRCWACGESGDCIDFASKFFGFSPMDAVKRLNEDFLLGLPIGRKMTDTDRKQAARRRELVETERMFNEWREQLANRLDQCCQAANRALARCGGDFTDAEALAIRSVSEMEYWSDILQFGTMEDMMAIFRDRKGVDNLCEQILKTTQTKSETA